MDYSSILNYSPKPEQLPLIDFVNKHHYSILASKMGSGKTLVGIASALMNMNGRILIICPAFLKFNWEAEFKKFSKRKKRVSVVTGKNIAKLKYNDSEVIIANYAILKKLRDIFEWADFIFFDEGHYLLNPKSIRTKLAVKYIKQFKPERVIIATGTINRGKTMQWYVPLLICSLNPKGTSGLNVINEIGSYWDFQHKFCYKNILNVGGREVTTFTGLKNKDLLLKLIRGKAVKGSPPDLKGIRLDFKEVMVDYKTDDKELSDAWEAHSEGNKIEEHIMSAKSASANMKAVFTVNYVKNLIEAGEGPICVYTDHLQSLDVICEGLSKKYKVAKINGSTPMPKRQEYVEGFQAGKYSVIAATITALNTGVTLTRSSNLVMNDENWIGTENEQVYHRIFRISQTKDCVIHKIYGSEVDKNISKNIKKGNKIISQIMERI